MGGKGHYYSDFESECAADASPLGYRWPVIPSSWIDGVPVTTDGGRHQVINPATGAAVAELALATGADVDMAVASARAALPGWSGATPAERSAVLAKLADPAIYTGRGSVVTDLQKEKARLEREVANAEKRWLAAQEALEAAA